MRKVSAFVVEGKKEFCWNIQNLKEKHLGKAARCAASEAREKKNLNYRKPLFVVVVVFVRLEASFAEFPKRR